MRIEVADTISIIALVIYHFFSWSSLLNRYILKKLNIYLYLWNVSTQRVSSTERLHKNNQSNHDIGQNIIFWLYFLNVWINST